MRCSPPDVFISFLHVLANSTRPTALVLQWSYDPMVRLICTRNSECLSSEYVCQNQNFRLQSIYATSEFTIKDGCPVCKQQIINKLAPLIFCLSFLTSVCYTKSAIYTELFSVYIWKHCYSVKFFQFGDRGQTAVCM